MGPHNALRPMITQQMVWFGCGWALGLIRDWHYKTTMAFGKLEPSDGSFVKFAPVVGAFLCGG